MTPQSSEADVVDLWIARPEQLHDGTLTQRWREWLSDEETRRLSAFRFERHRHEYLVTRALVRTALSSYRAVRPEDWRFRANEYGRPELEPPRGLHFNLSNTPSLVVCLVSERYEIGVDVEPLSRSPEILEVADTVFSTGELSELYAREGEARHDRAVSLWTIKESYIKARGAGMSLPLKEITIRFEGAPAPRLELGAALNDTGGAWCVRTIDVDAHRVACSIRAGADSLTGVRVIEGSIDAPR